MQPIILAAGKGTRMGGDDPKTLTKVAGKPMLGWILDTLAQVPGIKTPIIVVGHKAEDVRAFAGPTYTYAMQEVLNGSAGAVIACFPYFPSDDEPVLILNGDHPFLSTESIEKIQEAFTKNPDALVMGTANIGTFDGWHSLFMQFGRVIRDAAGNIISIVEYKNANEEEKKITEVNPNVHCVAAGWLRKTLPGIKPNVIGGERYITEIVALANAEKKRIVSVDLSPEEVVGLNSPEDVANAELLLRTRG